MRIIQCDVPVDYEALWAKMVRWFGRYGVPVFARKWFQTVRSRYEQRDDSSLLKDVANAWNVLSPVTRSGWDAAANACWEYNRGYRMYSSDYIWRHRANLPAPEGAMIEHQLFGLRMLNPGGSLNIFMRRDDKDVVGQINVKFSYRKLEVTPNASFPFRVLFTGYYFEGGENKTDVETWSAPGGNVGWTMIDHNFGIADRNYFHIKIIFTIQNYDAEIFLDNIIWTDKNSEFYREHFNTDRYVPWVPNLLYRKRDWQFSPGFSTTYFQHIYLT